MPPTNLFWRTYRPTEGFYSFEVQAPDPLPVRTFLPGGYEPNYPYPLLVFFHGHGSSEEQVLRLAPRLSRRNYICIGLRGLHPVSASEGTVGSLSACRGADAPRTLRTGYTWGDDASTDAVTEEYLFRAIEQTRRHYHVHSERIYLAGVHEGATLAYRLGLQFPDRFAGVIALNGVMPRRGAPLLHYPRVRQLRVFIGHGIANPYVPPSDVKADYRLLYIAGVPVCRRSYPTTNRLHPDMLRDINRWVMEPISAPWQ